MLDKTTSTPTYVPGERVTVTLAGVRITDVVERTIIVDLGNDYYVAIPHSDNVLVERVSPAGGPITIGDIWEDQHGERWFARSGPTGLTVVPQGGGSPTGPENLARWYSPLKRVYRHEPEPCAYPADRENAAASGPCQVEPYSAPHAYNQVREVGPDWEVCGEHADHPIHQVATDEDGGMATLNADADLAAEGDVW